MSTLKQQNTVNIDTIFTNSKDTATRYEEKSYIFLLLTNTLEFLLIIIGISTTILELVSNGSLGFKISIAIIGCLISAIGLYQTKFKPAKRGALYKASAARVRKLGRLVDALRWQKSDPERIAEEIEKIYSELDDIDLEIYSLNEAGQGAMKEGFGDGIKIINSSTNIEELSSVVVEGRNENNKSPPRKILKSLHVNKEVRVNEIPIAEEI